MIDVEILTVATLVVAALTLLVTLIQLAWARPRQRKSWSFEPTGRAGLWVLHRNHGPIAMVRCFECQQNCSGLSIYFATPSTLPHTAFHPGTTALVRVEPAGMTEKITLIYQEFGWLRRQFTTVPEPHQVWRLGGPPEGARDHKRVLKKWSGHVW